MCLPLTLATSSSFHHRVRLKNSAGSPPTAVHSTTVESNSVRTGSSKCSSTEEGGPKTLHTAVSYRYTAAVPSDMLIP